MRFGLLMLFGVVLAPLSLAGQNCTKGIRCGNSCIAANKTCRIGTSSPAPAYRPPASTGAAAAAVGAAFISSVSAPKLDLQDLAILTRMGAEPSIVHFSGGEEFTISPAVREILRQASVTYQAEVRARMEAAAPKVIVGRPELLDTSRTYPRTAADSSYVGSLLTGLYSLTCGRPTDIPADKRRYFRSAADAERAGFVLTGLRMC